MDMKVITSWSVSKISQFNECPRKYKANYLMGKPFKQNWAMKRGIRIHSLAENYVNGEIYGMPKELNKLSKAFRALRKTDPFVELRLAIDNAWKKTTWKKGWFRGILDVMGEGEVETEALIIDHKTGKIYEKHRDGAEIYSCLVKAAVPDVESVHVEYWYIDQGEIKTWDFNTNQINEATIKWDENAKRMLSAKRFPETPSEHACKWCEERSDKGGRCEGWRRV